MTTPLTHEEATELAGLYVLDALTPEERAAVDAHLAGCSEPHPEFDEVGGVAPALATLADPKGAPASLKNKVMADYRAGAGARVWDMAPTAPKRPASRSWLGWAAAAAAVLIIAVTAGWAYTAQSRADLEAQRAQQVSAAIDLMAQPNSSVAFLSGTDTALGAHGFAAFGANGNGYLVMVGLPNAPQGRTYEAWYLSGSQATAAGLMSVDSGGYAVLTGSLAGVSADAIALTIENAGGADQPTSAPIAIGVLREPTVPVPAG